MARKRAPRKHTRVITSGVRDALAEFVDLPGQVGYLAGQSTPHRFRNLTYGLGGGWCLLCFGWVDDLRHTLPAWQQEIEEETARVFEDEQWK